VQLVDQAMAQQIVPQCMAAGHDDVATRLSLEFGDPVVRVRTLPPDLVPAA
jgi:hypothetical protein